jgi:hypothetical protein
MEALLAGCEGRVAVVGNGPLSSEDRASISQTKCVIRFNDTKNYKQGEHTTLHVSRDVNGTFPGAHMHTDVPLLPVARTHRAVAQYDALEKRRLLPTLLVHEVKDGSDNDLDADDSRAQIFDGCSLCSLDGCKHSLSSAGPSTGALVLNELQNLESIDTIAVFGMNWNGGSHHVDFVVPEIVPSCCRKCTIHETPNEHYDDRTWLSRFFSR